MTPATSPAIATLSNGVDPWDGVVWVATALDLVESAGIRTPRSRLILVGGHSVLILRRCNRTNQDHRVGCISAMTALNSTDGEHCVYAEGRQGTRKYRSSLDRLVPCFRAI